MSHAVGCAFTICLEAKKKREAEQAAAAGLPVPPPGTSKSSSKSTTADLNAVWNAPTPPPIPPPSNNTFAKANPAYASFRRQLSITERKQDPQTAIVNDPVPSSAKAVRNESTIKPRPVANPSLFDRQGSFKAPMVSQQTFKRFNSLRSDLLSRPVSSYTFTKYNKRENFRTSTLLVCSTLSPFMKEKNFGQIQPCHRLI